MTAWGLALLVVALGAAWLALRARSWLVLTGLPLLARVAPADARRLPRLSLIVPACDEEDTIVRAAETLLRQDYPDLEIILIDDRSRDRTRERIAQLAERDERVRCVFIDELPEGWLGKVHALSQGAARATGEWLLFCDADVYLTPGSLRRALSLAIADGLDHLAVLPQMSARSLCLEATYCAFGLAYLGAIRPRALAAPESTAYAGVGAFNLVRAEALERGGGFRELKMEVADDMGVGFVVKAGGGSTGLALGRGEVSVAWYDSLGDMMRGLEKNLFGAIGHYRLPLALARISAYGVLSAAPLAAAVFGVWHIVWGSPLTAWVAGLGAALLLLALVASALRIQPRLGQRPAAGILEPAGAIALCYMGLRSAVLTQWRGGVVWRGTFYSLAELRAGQRVRV